MAIRGAPGTVDVPADAGKDGGDMVDVTLHLGDCLQVMKSMPDKSVDAVITDPPYGNDTAYNKYDDSRENLSLLVPQFMEQCLRISSGVVVVTCGVKNIFLYPEYTWVLSWVNMAGVGSTQWGFSCWQPIIVYGKDPYLSNGRGRRPDTFLQKKNEVADVGHPCPKPNNVMRWIVDRTITKQNATILDPFMGTGTTGIAATQFGHGFIGIEIDPTYFAIAERRIKDAQQQPRLEAI
jgi:site-specific DNA-methyltransferase (adenine-specific)